MAQHEIPTAIDIFCGAGGLTVGLKKAGFKVIAGIELSESAAKTYRMNHKNVSMFNEDVNILDPVFVMRDLNIGFGELDLMAGCPPCQGFSSHRTRNRLVFIEDKRNDLIFRFLDYVKAFNPKSIMLENVPGLMKDNRLTLFVKELKRLGYLFSEHSLKIEDAADFGVPQRRKRLILQVSRLGFIDDAKPVKKRKTVKQAIGFLPAAGSSGDPLHDLGEVRSEKTLNIIRMIPKDGGSRADIPKEYWLPCHVNRPNSYRDVYGRMSWDKVSPTITGGCHNPSKGRFLHPAEDRAITLREAALLQTFPRKYKFDLNKGKEAVALMIGNALPPTFIKCHAVNFFNHLIASKEKGYAE
ncbi:MULTISPECIES: DNA cytosine methyltransferase [unclassified Halomonas]|uniref:DNA cytosine methyltransferase n=1 Tax=unclassified Halomonas TaxID=2609666 RepID=UPI0007D8D49C|nr:MULTISPECIES: DNA cytosine methyltransferase [unclassified Halomonas]MBT2787791.1 DNA cytosine methyltransferase [Halomonas sp. ISL-106]MBT2799598.1 DNA cytosine methyltransferase [Halomonas sp. ISL-104]OAL61440.1 DNA (cytosine-5-)-methyltransferase [Halomonas sp. ALS9]